MRLFTDPNNSATYWNALLNNLKFIAVEYVIIIPIQLLVSYAFYRKIHFHKFSGRRFSSCPMCSVPQLSAFSAQSFSTRVLA